jgi:hypothetical protein
MAKASRARIKKIQARVIKNGLTFDAKSYQYSDRFVEWDGVDPLGVHTTAELVKLLESNKKVDIEARVLGVNKKGELCFKTMGKKEFLESYKSERTVEPSIMAKAFKESNKKLESNFKESGIDYFGTDVLPDNQIGNDFVPMMGGAYNKQLYYFDYLRMHFLSFFAKNHDSIARAYVNIMRDFTLGRGWRADVKCKDPRRKGSALALWRSFEDVNELYSQINFVAEELPTYGEIMFWKLPGMATKITYDLVGNQRVPVGAIPRVRLLDPSAIWEIITFPEDITRVLSYRFIAPTQWQMFSGSSEGSPVPGTKFIYQDIPGSQVLHVKVNCVSNEKRGRSDLFPALGYMKRLRDSVDYAVVAMQKAAAWSLDTTIEGSPADVDAYVESQQELGTIPPAGSEFAHTNKIKRDYLSNAAAGKQTSGLAFEWSLSMACAALGMPFQYLGTYLNGGSTRASALVSTEPVSKKFQARQLVYEKILQSLARWLFDMYGFQDCELEVTFPELIEQDRNKKFQDLTTAQQNGWISQRRASEIAARELGITEFDFKTEKEEISKEGALMQSESVPPQIESPLSAPPQGPLTIPKSDNQKPTAITGEQRRVVAQNEKS